MSREDDAVVYFRFVFEAFQDSPDSESQTRPNKHETNGQQSDGVVVEAAILLCQHCLLAILLFVAVAVRVEIVAVMDGCSTLVFAVGLVVPIVQKELRCTVAAVVACFRVVTHVPIVVPTNPPLAGVRISPSQFHLAPLFSVARKVRPPCVAWVTIYFGRCRECPPCTSTKIGTHRHSSCLYISKPLNREHTECHHPNDRSRTRMRHVDDKCCMDFKFKYSRRCSLERKA